MLFVLLSYLRHLISNVSLSPPCLSLTFLKVYRGNQFKAFLSSLFTNSLSSVLAQFSDISSPPSYTYPSSQSQQTEAKAAHLHSIEMGGEEELCGKCGKEIR